MFSPIAPDMSEMKRTTPETITLSQCCSSPVTASTPDDLNKIDINNTSSLLMIIEFICNKCGKICKVKEVYIE